MDKNPNLPIVLGVFWATPTEDGRARYVVGFGRKLEPHHIEAFNRLIQQHGGFTTAEIGPMPSQATVILNNSDPDYMLLDWLKLELTPDTPGTVIIELYPEANPVTARLIALGGVQFEQIDLRLIGSLRGIHHVALADGVVTAVFDQNWVGQVGREALVASFMEQEEFAPTVVAKPGTPEA